MGKLRVGMTELGFGAEFIPIYEAYPGVEVGAICQRNEQRLDGTGERFGIANRYTSYESPLADDSLGFIHINTPIPDHAWMSISAMEAGTIGT